MTETDIPEFGIPQPDEERRDGGCAIVFDPESQLYAVGEHTEDGLFRLFSGGVDAEETIEAGTLRELKEESGLVDYAHVEKIAEARAHYHNVLKQVNRVAHATCFLVILKSVRRVDTQLEEHEKFKLVWVSAEEIMANWEKHNGKHDLDHWVYFLEKSVARAKELGYDTSSQ